MKKLIILFFILFFSCSQKNYIKKPNPFIEKDKMENIIFDIVFYKKIYQDNINDSILPETNIGEMNKSILEKYQISDSIFYQNNRYYFYKTDIYQEIMDNILNRLEKLKEAKKDTLDFDKDIMDIL